MIRSHVRWSHTLAHRLAAEPGFSLVAQPVLSLFSFAHNLSLVTTINDDGRLYLTQTKVEGRIAIRFQTGSIETTVGDLDVAFDVIRGLARKLL